MGRKGLLVETVTGKKGRTYHDEPMYEEKYKVHLINEKYELTGEKLLCSSESLTIKGYAD